MTISAADNTPRVSYTVAESVLQTSFTVSFEFFSDVDLNVYVDEVLKVITTDYTVTGGDGSTGSITMSVTGASSGSTVVITRSIALERTSDFPTSGPFDIAALNTELDRMIAISADYDDNTGRSLILVDYDSAVDMTIPLLADRASKLLGFDANGLPIASAGSAGDVTVSTFMATVLDDISASDAKKSLAIFGTEGLLQSDTVLTYSNVSVGDYVEAGGFRFIVVASSGDMQNSAATPVHFDKLYHVALEYSKVGRATNPTVVVNPAAGVLNGTYYYMVSYVTDDGETSVSVPVSASPANEQVDVTLPVSTDSRVTARKLYRTPLGFTDSVLGELVTTISDNTTTAYTDNIADVSLGANAPHLDTTGGLITNGSDTIGNVGGLATTLGIEAMPNPDGYANTALGAYALSVNAGGYRNTGIGVDALRLNTTGYNNTGLGVHALDANTTGKDNTGIGINTLFSNDTGDANLAFGSNAGANLVGGDNNMFMGYTAGQLRTAGSENVFLGSQAGYAAGTGIWNAVVGSQSGKALLGGNFNTFFGGSAGAKTTSGNQNVSVGYTALNENLTGGNNVAIGNGAGYWETASNHLWVDYTSRTNLADAKTKALIYGEFWSDRNGQKLDFNGQANFLAGFGATGRDVTADGTVIADDTVISCNKAGTLTLTLVEYKYDKIVILRNKTANTVVSATANIEPIGGGSHTTAILPATAGSWAVIRQQASGTQWEIVMQG